MEIPSSNESSNEKSSKSQNQKLESLDWKSVRKGDHIALVEDPKDLKRGFPPKIVRITRRGWRWLTCDDATQVLPDGTTRCGRYAVPVSLAVRREIARRSACAILNKLDLGAAEHHLVVRTLFQALNVMLKDEKAEIRQCPRCRMVGPMELTSDRLAQFLLCGHRVRTYIAIGE